MTRFEHALKGASLSLGLRYTKRRAWARLQQPLDKRFAGVIRACRTQARGHLGRRYSRLQPAHGRRRGRTARRGYRQRATRRLRLLDVLRYAR